MPLDLTIDDLDLDLGLVVPPSRGRRKAELSHQFQRDLTEADIAILIANPVRDVTTPSIQKLKHSHHQLARLLAEGRKAAECALITGYSPSRISLLKQDPAFAELMEYYSGQVEEVFINVHERLASLGLDALEELQERLETTPKSFSNKELQDLVGTTMDRAGFGPKSTQVNEFKFSVDGLLAEVKDQVRKKAHGSIKTLDARPNQPETQGDIRTGLRLAIDNEAEQHSDLSPSGSQG